jgi:AcrR family transcriptional regulator
MARPRSEAARRKVLGAASDLMAARGVASLTIDEVATVSGVAKTTIYRHWPERSSLIVDAVNAQLEHVRIPDTGSLRGDLEAFFGAMIRSTLSGNVGQIIPCLVEAAGRDPEMASLLERIGAERERIITAIVSRAVDRGELHNGLDIDTVVGVIVGPVVFQKLIRRRPLTATYIGACLDVVLGGLDQMSRA